MTFKVQLENCNSTAATLELWEAKKLLHQSQTSKCFFEFQFGAESQFALKTGHAYNVKVLTV